DDVGIDGVEAVLLGQIDVLLGGGVDDDVAAVDGLVQPVAAQVAQDQPQPRVAHAQLEQALGVAALGVDVVLAVVLGHQLAPQRAGGARDEHGLHARTSPVPSRAGRSGNVAGVVWYAGRCSAAVALGGAA